MSIELALILIGVLLVMAWTWRYRDDENRRLRDKVDETRAQVAGLVAECGKRGKRIASLEQTVAWLKSELGATEDAAAQDVELWR